MLSELVPQSQVMEISLPDGTVIAGAEPMVFVGANGSGKTTVGAAIAKSNGYEWISATRNLQFDDNIAMALVDEASRQLAQQKDRQKDRPWMMANELSAVLAKLKAEDAESAIRFRDAALETPEISPDITKIRQLSKLWHRIFPRRKIDFASYSPAVTAEHRENAALTISKMSGGERVGLYASARK